MLRLYNGSPDIDYRTLLLVLSNNKIKTITLTRSAIHGGGSDVDDKVNCPTRVCFFRILEILVSLMQYQEFDSD